MITKQSILKYNKLNRIIFRDHDFIYLFPHASLRKWISNYSITFPYQKMMSEQYTIMPHGSTIMVFTVRSSHIPQKELTSLLLPLCDFDSTLYRLIVQKLETTFDVDTLITKISRLFMTYIKTSFYQQEFSLANQKIINSGGSLPVKMLSEETHYSERHLNRLFDKYLGIGMYAVKGSNDTTLKTAGRSG